MSEEKKQAMKKEIVALVDELKENLELASEIYESTPPEKVGGKIVDFLVEKDFNIPDKVKVTDRKSKPEQVYDATPTLEEVLEMNSNSTLKFVERTYRLMNKILKVDFDDTDPIPIIYSTLDLLSRVTDKTATTGLMHAISQYISNDRRAKGGYKILPELMPKVFNAINDSYDHQIEDIRSSRGSPVQIKVGMKNYNEKHLQNIRYFFSEVHNLTLQAATNPYSLDEEVKEKGVEEVLKNKIYQAAENIFGVKMNGSKSKQYFVNPSDIEEIARSEGPEGFENIHGESIGTRFRNIRNHTKITIHTKKDGGYNSVKILFREPVDIHTDSMMLQLTSLAIKRGFVDRPELMDGTNKTHRCIERGYLRTQ